MIIYIKKPVILLFILLSSSFYTYGQKWHKQDLASIASVEFPSQPELTDTLNYLLFTHLAESAYYMVNIQDLSSQPNFKINHTELESFYSGVIEGLLKSADGKLVKKSSFKMSGYNGVDIEYTSDANPNLPDLRYNRIIMLKNNLVILSFWTISGNKEYVKADKEKYFNSFTVKK